MAWEARWGLKTNRYPGSFAVASMNQGISFFVLHKYLSLCGMLHKWTKKTTCSTEACFVTAYQFGQIQVNEPSNVADVSDEFLTDLVSELDNDTVSAIILKGSCARGDETPYSDIDLTLLVHNEPEHPRH